MVQRVFSLISYYLAWLRVRKVSWALLQVRWFEPSSRGGWLMLPTDLLLRNDPALRVHAEEFFDDETAFHRTFAVRPMPPASLVA